MQKLMSEPPHVLEVCNHHATGMLEIAWSDGVTGILAHRVLRESCRCAHCTADMRRGQPVRASDGTRIVSIEALGGSMLQLVFNDGHQRGIYPLAYLRALAAPGN
jgi:DUF971 family protein